MNTNENGVSIFNHELFGDTRFVTEGDSFVVVAKDVVEKVGNVWKGDAGSLAHIPEQWKVVRSVQTSFGTKDTICLSEQGLYFYLGRCDKPAALQYQMWIAGEVVPSIRKRGGYLVSKPDDTPEILISRALLMAKDKIDVLEGKLADAEPKVILADSFLTEGAEISMGDLAKKLNREGVDIGQNRLFAFLRGKGVLISRPGINFNMPTQKYAERGWFKIIQPPVPQMGKWKKQIRVTPKGVLEISNRMHELFGSDL